MISLSFVPGRQGDTGRQEDLISRLPGGKIALIERGARLPAGFGPDAAWLCEVREPPDKKFALARPIKPDPEELERQARQARYAAQAEIYAAYQVRARKVLASPNLREAIDASGLEVAWSLGWDEAPGRDGESGIQTIWLLAQPTSYGASEHIRLSTAECVRQGLLVLGRGLVPRLHPWKGKAERSPDGLALWWHVPGEGTPAQWEAAIAALPDGDEAESVRAYIRCLRKAQPSPAACGRAAGEGWEGLKLPPACVRAWAELEASAFGQKYGLFSQTEQVDLGMRDFSDTDSDGWTTQFRARDHTMRLTQGYFRVPADWPYSDEAVPGMESTNVWATGAWVGVRLRAALRVVDAYQGYPVGSEVVPATSHYTDEETAEYRIGFLSVLATTPYGLEVARLKAEYEATILEAHACGVRKAEQEAQARQAEREARLRAEKERQERQERPERPVEPVAPAQSQGFGTFADLLKRTK